MQVPSNDLKSAQIAAFLLAQAGGTLTYPKLVELIHIANEEMYDHRAKVMVDDGGAGRYRNGHLRSRVLDLIQAAMEHPGSGGAWAAYIQAPPSIDSETVSLRPDAKTAPGDLSQLSEFEIDQLARVYGTYAHVSPGRDIASRVRMAVDADRQERARDAKASPPIAQPVAVPATRKQADETLQAWRAELVKVRQREQELLAQIRTLTAALDANTWRTTTGAKAAVYVPDKR